MTLDMNSSTTNPLGQNPVAGAMSAVANATTGVVNTVASAANSAATTAVNAVNSVASAATTVMNSAANSSQKALSFNSLIPFGNSSPPPTNKNTVNSKTSGSASSAKSNSGFNIFGSNSGAKKNSGANSGFNIFGSNTSGSSNSSGSNASASAAANSAGIAAVSWISPLWVFIALLVVFLVIFAVLNRQIRQGYEYLSKSIKQSMGVETQPISPPPPIIPDGPLPEPVVTPPIAPQTLTPKQTATMNNLVEKVLPTGGNEVFNVSQNKFTYYDAEPLCKALGAELASYDQVKDAWSKGADWCNYGWVKGQMAVYPTQQGTYDTIQSGPPEEHGACGTVGMNGGYFDNPEMLYGVNCYGKKPSQSAHDEEMLMRDGKIPKTVDALKVDQKVRDFDAQVDSMLVRPFSDSKWSSV